MSFTVIPAIDLRAGRVVRLKQGDYAQQTTYAADPGELARQYAEAGARWLHLVDLDGARSGHLDNLAIVEAIARADIAVQAGGGVRDETAVRQLFDVGVSRVVVGSVAIREPERVAGWLDAFGPDRFTIALDTRLLDGRWILPSAGWTEVEERTLDELVPWYEHRGARHVLCTDIERDGMLGGINLELYRHLAGSAPGLAIQASGGVRSLDDIRAARAAGAQG
ncbi:MAG: HisA/HisF-related TIM barrel protein, partial [Rhodanobacter sp.]